MSENFILWRCLHSVLCLGKQSTSCQRREEKNWRLAMPLTFLCWQRSSKTYGTCAILARDGSQIVGFLRFYPKLLYSMEDAGALCLQQAFPAGPSRCLAEKGFTPLEEIKDKTLRVHCMMTGSPLREENPYQRKGIGTKMVRELMQWAKEKGWRGIEATTYEDLDILYANTGQAGKRFWEKLGFQLVKTETEPGFGGEFLKTMQKQAEMQNLPPEKTQNKYTMQIQLT